MSTEPSRPPSPRRAARVLTLVHGHDDGWEHAARRAAQFGQDLAPAGSAALREVGHEVPP